MWTHSIDLGAVHGAQYSGYLWPMGPIFALLHSIGLSAWVAQRIWLGLIFAISTWGVLRLFDAFVGRPRGVAHLVAAAFYLLNPYTVIFTGRTSIALLGYAALPWLLLIVYRGVRELRGWPGWWWAAAFALILTSIGGGINGAVVGWMLVGPLVLLIYEPLIGSVRWRDSAGFLVRVGVVGTLASLWWIVPAGGARRVRHRLPPVHRAAALDLGDQQRARGAAADGVLDVVHRRRVLRRRSPAVQRGGHAAVQPARGGRVAAAAGARARRLRADAGAGATPRSCCWCCWSGWGSRWRRSRTARRAATRWSGSTATCRSCASCAPPRRRPRWWRSG